MRLESDRTVWMGGWIAPGSDLEITVDGEVVALVALDDLGPIANLLYDQLEASCIPPEKT